jgi:hypothetical protein
MIKFIHKKHIHKAPNVKAFIIYYSVSDIILGFLLIVLVAFFIYNYLQNSFWGSNRTYPAVDSSNSSYSKVPPLPSSATTTLQPGAKKK